MTPPAKAPIRTPRRASATTGAGALIGLLLCVFSALAACDRPADLELTSPGLTAAPPTFVPGDRMEVRVYGEEALSGEFQVQDDGSVVFPLIGRLELQGLSQAEGASAIAAALADGYLRDPNVTVVILERQNVEISVLGQVSSPGSLPFVDQLSLVQAISEAGGLTPLAASRRVKITRKTPEGPRTFEVSLQAITEGRAPDILLRPGDIVFVPESAI